MATVDTTALVNLAIAEAPAIISAFKALFVQGNPDSAAPTSADVITAFNSAFDSSLAKDEQWLAAHPETPNAG